MDSVISQYSADVVLTLIAGGSSFALSHAGPNEIVVRDCSEPIPPGDAQLVIRVDGVRKRKKIYLPHGVPAADQPVMFF